MRSILRRGVGIAGAALLASCGGGQPRDLSGGESLRPMAAEVPAPAALRSFNGSFADYTVSLLNGTASVRGTSSTTTSGVAAGVKRLIFDDRYVDLDLQGPSAQVYRLYRAAFGREPDLSGLGYQVGAAELTGSTLDTLAANFLASPEFQQKYGNLGTAAFVTQLYQNVLGRAPDSSGLAFHSANLDSGRLQRQHVLTGFSESPENQQLTGPFVKNGVVFAPQQVYAWPLADYVSIPNNIAAVSYPAGYSLARAAAVPASNPCEIAPVRIEFPAAYLGRYVLPPASGAPLNSAIQRGLVLKDAWKAGNITFNDGCTGDARQAFTRTLERARALNVDTIELTPWTFIDTSKATWRIAHPDELKSSIISDSDLTWAVQQARASGIKIRWINQIQGALGSAIPSPTLENVTKFLEALEPYMVERAAFAQSIGIDAMQLNCGYCWGFQSNVEPFKSVVDSRMATIAGKVKAVFSGKLYYDGLEAGASSGLKQALDYNMWLLHSAWVPLTESEKQNLSLPLLKGKLRDAIRSISTVADVSKPMIWRLTLPSRASVFSTGYLEETFCSSGFDLISSAGTQCIQRSMTTDFSVQALFHQAALEAIAEQNLFQTHAVEVDYWMTDGILPASTFPNLATSIRNKPAEALVKAWFSR
jgi:hypothetical protein